jgi:hypothetical protein
MVKYTQNWTNLVGKESPEIVDGKRTGQKKNKVKKSHKDNNNDGGKKTRRSSTKDGSTRKGNRNR